LYERMFWMSSCSGLAARRSIRRFRF